MKHLEFIMMYECGDLDTIDELYAGLQAMIDDGTVWTLQGCYGRLAHDFIQSGHCKPAQEVN